MLLIHNVFPFTQKTRCILDALELESNERMQKKSMNILMENKLNATIYITVNTLDYLKKGGRVTPAAAALGGDY